MLTTGQNHMPSISRHWSCRYLQFGHILLDSDGVQKALCCRHRLVRGCILPWPRLGPPIRRGDCRRWELALGLSVKVRNKTKYGTIQNLSLTLPSVPAGAVSWGLIFFSMPPNFPATSEIEAPAPQPSQFWSQQWSLIRQVDFLGAFLVLAASVFIVAALQEGNYEFGWDSSAVIIFFVLSGICVPLFLLWQWLLSRRELTCQPMLPWRLLTNRLFMGTILYVWPASRVS